MGFIKLTYNVRNSIVQINSLIHEIEYGNTFALYRDREEIVVHRGKNFKWVDYSVCDNELTIKVDDTFFHLDFFFEKFLSVFVYNLLDFGNVYLKEFDISNSYYAKLITTNTPIDNYGQGYFRGTIFKPYYHLSNNQKIKQTEMFISNGLNVLKNDECYFKTKKELKEEVCLLIKHIDQKAHFVPNISGYINDYEFIKELIDMGIQILMVDFLISGFNSIFKLKQKFPSIKIWGHRIGYVSLEKFMSMQVLSMLAVLAGIDYLHIGTPVGENILEKSILVKQSTKIKPDFMPIFTKTTPDVIESLLPVFGNRSIYMACGYFRNKNGQILKENISEWNKSFELRI
jgi:hypothetical protein